MDSGEAITYLLAKYGVDFLRPLDLLVSDPDIVIINGRGLHGLLLADFDNLVKLIYQSEDGAIIEDALEKYVKSYTTLFKNWDGQKTLVDSRLPLLLMGNNSFLNNLYVCLNGILSMAHRMDKESLEMMEKLALKVKGSQGTDLNWIREHTLCSGLEKDETGKVSLLFEVFDDGVKVIEFGVGLYRE